MNRKTKMSPAATNFGVLVLGFNRPMLLARNLNSFLEFAELRNFDFFLSLDGPRDSDEQTKVDACRDVFDEFAKHTRSSVKYFSQANRGLRDSVVTGITRAFEDKDIDYLVVVEDDCVLGPSALHFFDWGFQQMSLRDDIGAVSGSYFGSHKSAVCFTATRFSSWGWGTNRLVWQSFLNYGYSKANVSPLGAEIRHLTKRAPLPYQYEYSRMNKNMRKLDSWAINFDMFLRSKRLLTLKPTVNQIQNIGFGADATHTGRGSSLSIDVGYLDLSEIQFAGQPESKRIEGLEAWSKLWKLTKEIVLSG